MSRGILAFGAGRWDWGDFAGSPRYHLWTLAGMGYRVIYVEPPIKYGPRTSVRKADDREFHVVTPGMTPPFSVGRIPSRIVAEPWRAVTSSRHASVGLGVARELGMELDLCWLGAPWHGAIAERLPRLMKTVHHVYDELTVSPALSSIQKRILTEWESRLLERCDLVVCSSLPQLEKRAAHGAKVKLLENAVADDFLLRGGDDPRLEEFLAMPEPRFVYGGVADHRLDAELFRALLDSPAVGSLSFLGVKTADFDIDESQYPGRLKFFGPMGYSTLGRFYREAAALVIAHKKSPFTMAMFPEKLNEYLASGAPVISVGLPEVRRVAAESGTANAIYIGDSPEEFQRLAAMAVTESGDDVRRERVRLSETRTWSAMGKKLDGYIRELE